VSGGISWTVLWGEGRPKVKAKSLEMLSSQQKTKGGKKKPLAGQMRSPRKRGLQWLPDQYNSNRNCGGGMGSTGNRLDRASEEGLKRWKLQVGALYEVTKSENGRRKR